MSAKTSADVLIGGKIYTLSGYESEEYLQKVANYINNKINEFEVMEQFRRFPIDMKATLVELNIADDYFKAKEQAETLEQDVREKDREIYELKHELISAQIKAESSEKTAAELEKENRELLLNKAKLEDALEDALLGKVKGQASVEEPEKSEAQTEEQKNEKSQETEENQTDNSGYHNTKEESIPEKTRDTEPEDTAETVSNENQNGGSEAAESNTEAENRTETKEQAETENHIKPEKQVQTDTYTRLSNNSEYNHVKTNHAKKNQNGGKNSRNFKYMNPSK